MDLLDADSLQRLLEHLRDGTSLASVARQSKSCRTAARRAAAEWLKDMRCGLRTVLLVEHRADFKVQDFVAAVVLGGGTPLRLQIVDCPLRDLGARLVAAAASSGRFQACVDLILTEVQIEDAGALALARAVACSLFPALEQLNLRKNRIGAEGALALCHSSCRILQLYLSQNAIALELEQAKRLGEQLRGHAPFRIDMRLNSIAREARHAVSKAGRFRHGSSAEGRRLLLTPQLG